MADVSGPVSSMPGSRRNPPSGMMCDDHPDRVAVSRVQGETDSMGAEFHDLCRECMNKFGEDLKEAPPVEGNCDWCKGFFVGLQKRRDYDEGMCGPIYQVCLPCIQKSNERAQEEYDDLRQEGHYWEFDDERSAYSER